MPSTDDTYFDIKRLHAVFAVSSLGLLIVTLWMLAADHWREWKVYQRTYRDSIEPWLTEASIRRQRSEEFRTRDEQLVRALDDLQAAVPDRALIERFAGQLREDSARRKTQADRVRRDAGSCSGGWIGSSRQPGFAWTTSSAICSSAGPISTRLEVHTKRP